MRRTDCWVRGPGEFFAEISFVAMDGGFAKVREYGSTAWSAAERAKRAAASKLTSRRRAVGFVTGSEYVTPSTPATFGFGFGKPGARGKGAPASFGFGFA